MHSQSALRRTLLLLALLFSSLGINVRAEQTITTWIYYNNPPFIVQEAQGLAYDFIDLLNRHAQNRFHFNLELVPRVRLNQYLAKGKQGVVLFVNPKWMESRPGQYLWTQPLLQDQNEVISPLTRPVNYENSASFEGLIFGTIRGHKYKGVEPLFIDGRAFRYDVNDETQVFRLLLAGRMDVTSQPRSMALAAIRAQGIQEQLYFSPKPLFTFKRYLLVTQELPEVQQFLTQLIEQLADDPEWHRIIERYQLEPATLK